MAHHWLLRIRSATVSVPLIVLGTAMGALCTLALAAVVPRRVLYACKRAWARYILAVCFVRASVDGTESLQPGQACVFCANHLSYLDPPLLIAALPVPVSFIAKKSLFSIPLFGWGMRVMGDIALDRDSARSAARSVARAGERVRQGSSLVVFPEGGRSLNGKLQPFLSGAFRLAIQTQVPVVPVAIRGTREALVPGSLFIRGGAVRVLIGQPIPTEGLSIQQKRTLARQVEQTIGRLLEA